MEFHRYAQVIHHHCNGGWFGPPWGFTPTSTCSCVGHPVSGLWQRTSCALFRLAFASAPHFLLNLASTCNSLVHSSIGTPSHFTRNSASTACRHTVSGSISLPTRGSFHLSLTVLCAIGRYEYFALEGGPPLFPRGFTCPAVLWIPVSLFTFRLRDYYPLWSSFPAHSARLPGPYTGPNPREVTLSGLGVFPVRSPLLGESRLISFPLGT